jgi:fused signal recognition particle receptor
MLAGLFGATHFDPAFWEQLEASLIRADLGLPASTGLVAQLRQVADRDDLRSPDQLLPVLRRLLLAKLPAPDSPQAPDNGPLVIMLVGVNGSGKTTTAARLGFHWQQQGRSVLLAAADTHRAAASQQLASWGQRLDVAVISGEPGSDPGAVVYNALQAALARQVEVVIIDTSGRMHTSHNLMAELTKLHTVAGKVFTDAPQQTYLVLDAATGHNALAQARAFGQQMPLTGTVLAKLDNSAQGGMALAVADELGLPVCYVGLGEGLQDLAPFDPAQYVDGLLAAVPIEPDVAKG